MVISFTKKTEIKGRERWVRAYASSPDLYTTDDAAAYAIDLASSRRSVSQGAAQKTAREKIKKARREEARERLWENLTKGRSGIHVPINLKLVN